VWQSEGGQDGEEEFIHFCDCLTRAQSGVRPDFIVEEKNAFHFSVRTKSTNALSPFG
jgi:hypothetical protein